MADSPVATPLTWTADNDLSVGAGGTDIHRGEAVARRIRGAFDIADIGDGCVPLTIGHDAGGEQARQERHQAGSWPGMTIQIRGSLARTMSRRPFCRDQEVVGADAIDHQEVPAAIVDLGERRQLA